MAALGMKSMGGTAWAVKNGVVTAEELLRYAMSLRVAAVDDLRIDSLEVLDHHLRVARGFTPMTAAEDGRAARPLAPRRRPTAATSLQGLAPLRQSRDAAPARLPPRSHPARVKSDARERTGTWETR